MKGSEHDLLKWLGSIQVALAIVALGFRNETCTRYGSYGCLEATVFVTCCARYEFIRPWHQEGSSGHSFGSFMLEGQPVSLTGGDFSIDPFAVSRQGLKARGQESDKRRHSNRAQSHLSSLGRVDL